MVFLFDYGLLLLVAEFFVVGWFLGVFLVGSFFFLFCLEGFFVVLLACFFFTSSYTYSTKGSKQKHHQEKFLVIPALPPQGTLSLALLIYFFC